MSSCRVFPPIFHEKTYNNNCVDIFHEYYCDKQFSLCRPIPPSSSDDNWYLILPLIRRTIEKRELNKKPRRGKVGTDLASFSKTLLFQLVAQAPPPPLPILIQGIGYKSNLAIW